MFLRDPLHPAPASLPALPQPHHPRPRPLRELNGLLARPATRAVWIAAAPGCGKTALVAEWARADAQRPVVWLRLDAADNDPAWLWQRLFEAAGLPRPGALDRIEAWAQPLRAAPKAARALWPSLGAHAVVVLDDFDAALADAPASGAADAVATVLRPLLAHAGPAQRLLLLARRPPPPGLLPEQAQGTLVAFDSAVLQLDAAERSAWRAPAEAGGWAAAAAWLAKADADGSSIPARRDLLAWIADDVVPALPAGQRALLERCAWWPEIVPDALSGAEPQALNDLAASGLASQSSTDSAGTLHPLLQAALRQRAAGSSAPAGGDMQHLAAQAGRLGLDGHDGIALAMWRQALTASGSAGDLAAAQRDCIAWIDRRQGDWLAAARHRLLAAAVELIEPAARPARLWLARARSLAPFAPREARAAADAARTAPDGDSGLQLQAEVLAVASQFQAFDDTEPLAQRLARLKALEPALADPASVGTEHAATAVAAYSALFLREPRHPDLSAWRQRIGALLGKPAVAADLRQRAAMLAAKDAWYRGQHTELALLALRAPGGAGREFPGGASTVAPSLGPYARLLAGLQAQYAAWASADWAAGLAVTEAALAEAESTGIALLDRHLRLHGACFAHLADDAPRADAWMAEVAATADPTRRMEVWHHLTVRAWLLLCRGDAAAARSTAEAAAEAGREMGPAPLAMALAVRVQATLDLGEAASAVRALRQELAAAATADNVLAQWHLSLIDLRLATARGDSAAHWTQLAAVLALSRRHALWAPIGPSPRALASALADALTAGLEPDTAARIATALALPAPPQADGRWPWPLVLRLEANDAGLTVLRHCAPLHFEGKPPRRLLELLTTLAQAGRPVPVAHLLDRHWPDLEGDRAAAAFEVALRRLRALLDVPQALRLSGGTLALNPACVWVETAPPSPAKRSADAHLPVIGRPSVGIGSPAWALQTPWSEADVPHPS